MTKQKRTKRITTARTGDGPTKERRSQEGGVYAELIGRDANDRFLIKRYRAAARTPLDLFRNKGVINEPEHMAGHKFRDAYFAAVLSHPAFMERINRHTTITGQTMSERTLRHAYRTLSPSDAEVIIDVCGHDRPLWNPKAIEKLRKGLGHLAVQWNMAAVETCELEQRS